MKKETIIEKEIALGYLTATIAKSMYLLTASEKMELGMIFINSAKEDMEEIEKEAKESGATEWANMPERDIRVTPPMVRRAIEKAWCDKQREEVNKTGSYAHNSFYKRSSTSAARLATMVYHLWGEDPKKRSRVRRLYYFFADYILAGQMKLFGKKYEDLVEVINYGDDDNCKSESIYDCLPKRFSRQQLNAKREEMKLVTETRKFIFKWLKKKWIVKVEGEEDVYEKLF